MFTDLFFGNDVSLNEWAVLLAQHFDCALKQWNKAKIDTPIFHLFSFFLRNQQSERKKGHRWMGRWRRSSKTAVTEIFSNVKDEEKRAILILFSDKNDGRRPSNPTFFCCLTENSRIFLGGSQTGQEEWETFFNGRLFLFIFQTTFQIKLFGVNNNFIQLLYQFICWFHSTILC
jgi:hypothetical protein